MRNQEVLNYIIKQDSPQKEICTSLRAFFFELFPQVEEKMKWGVPSYAGGLWYIVALKDHVNLGVSIQGIRQQEIQQLQGTGKTMRTIAFYKPEEIDRQRIEDLLKNVLNHNKQ